MAKTIEIKPLIHQNTNRLGLYFTADQELNSIVKTFADAKWSQTHKCWHIANNRTNLKELFSVFRGKAYVNADALFLPKPKEKVLAKPIEKTTPTGELNAEHFKKIAQFKDWLSSRRYSPNTIKTYTDALRTFLKFFHNKPIAEINNQDLIRFNNEYILHNGFSSSLQNQVVNAIKLFYRKIENSEMEVDLIHRPKREKKLPNVLSKEDVELILRNTANMKHKAALSLLYSCGLRRSELLNLRINDVDSKRNLLIVRNAKGRKDRIVPLSLKVLELLRNYYKEYKPKIYLFEGQNGLGKYSEQSLQKVLKNSLALAKIKKPVTLHWLRHSYATHLLESGTDLRYIQEILGHKSSKTTEIYTYVSTKSIQKIKSPIDDFNW
jgi:integrase/recombinase XerD